MNPMLLFWMLYTKEELDKEQGDYDLFRGGEMTTWETVRAVLIGVAMGLWPWVFCKFILGWKI